MLTRSAASPATISQRSSAMRRQRRRSAATNHLYCATNGCTTYLEVNPVARVAVCPICGYLRRLS